MLPRLLLSMLFTLLPAMMIQAQDSTMQLKQIFHAYHEQYLILFPIEATQFGDTRYNDQLPIDIAPEFRDKERRFYEQTLSALRDVDTSKVSELDRLAAQILAYELEIRLEGLRFDTDRIPFNQFYGLPLTFAQLGSGSSSQPFNTPEDYNRWLRRVENFEAWTRIAVERFRNGIKEGYTLPRPLVEKMIQQCNAESLITDNMSTNLFYDPVRKLPERIAPAEQARIKNAYEKAIREKIIPAYQRLGTFLRDEYLSVARDTSGIGVFPQGKEHYLYLVKRWTTTDMTPDEIFDRGQEEVARIEREMDQVRQQMGFEGTLSEFFVYLREDPQFRPFKNPQEVIAFFEGIHQRLQPKLEDAFRKRPKTAFEIRRTESFREKTASAEYMPGSADGSRPGIFYCPIPDATQFNITSGMESLFLHEAIPGHHFQVSLQQENEGLPEFAKFLWYGAYGEGWALYCESIGEELGMYQDPRQKIGALGDEMHRAIRLVVDPGMHWKGWTREQAIEYMMSHEPISEDNAIAEVERYMAYPGQALAYKIGQLKISELRRQQQEKLGDSFSLPVFHETILHSGGMPLSLLEEQFK